MTIVRDDLLCHLVSCRRGYSLDEWVEAARWYDRAANDPAPPPPIVIEMMMMEHILKMGA